MDAIGIGISSFAATNIDDLLLLMLFFSQAKTARERLNIVLGQYIGFFFLVAMSLLGFVGALFIPLEWIGWLGLVPIAIGIRAIFRPDDGDDEQEEAQLEQGIATSGWRAFFNPQVYSVAAITAANGGDNIAIYIPIFASSSFGQLILILVTFFCMVGLWCYFTYQSSQQALVMRLIQRHKRWLIPLVFIGLGVVILLETGALGLVGID